MSGKPRKLIVSCRWTSAITRLPRRFSSWTRSRSRRISRSFCFRIGWSAVTMRKTHRTSLKPIAIGPPPPLGMRGGALHVLAPGPAPHAPVVEDHAAAEDRVGGPRHDRVPEGLAVGLRPDRRVDLAQNPVRRGVRQRQVVQRRFEPDVEVRELASSLRGRRESLYAREVEQVDGAARRVGQHHRLGDRQPLGQRWAGAMVALEAARPRAPHFLDEDADELGLLAVEAERDTPTRAVPRRRGGHPTHQEVEVTQVVRVGHRIGAAARRVRREVQPLVEHVVLERADSLFADQPVDLVELLRRHDAEVVAEVRVCVARRGGDDLGKDRAIRTTLVEVVLARPEVAQHRRDATRERGGGLARRVGGEVTVDADVKVRVDRPRKDEAPTRVHDVGRIPGRDPVGERGDATVADTDIAAEGTDVGHDDGAVEHGRVVARHGADYTIMTISRGSTALLLLDLQRDFLDPDGVYARHGLPVSRLRGIITTIARVAAASRAAHVPIFASKFTVYTSPAGAPLGLDHIVKARPFLRTTGFRLGDRGRELIPELGPVDYELDKPRFSAFHGTPLEVLLRSLEIDTVVLTGIVTHGGVEGTARDAMIRDFSVVILEDCVAAFDEELHLASLRGMGMYVTVMDAAAYLKALAE